MMKKRGGRMIRHAEEKVKSGEYVLLITRVGVSDGDRKKVPKP
jgi:hypothetical protein